MPLILTFGDLPPRIQAALGKENLKEQFLDVAYYDRPRLDILFDKEEGKRNSCPEVIIGAGLHAATYAVNRRSNGSPLPLCLEKHGWSGGILARARRSVFYLNSRNRPEQELRRPGSSGPLNSIIGGIFQPSELSGLEYQDQSDFALAIRTHLAMYTCLSTRAKVVRVERAPSPSRYRYRIFLDTNIGADNLDTDRVIVATGLTEPRLSLKVSGEKGILTFPDFLSYMGNRAIARPLKGFKRVALIGAGDSARVTAEFLLGLGPQPGRSTAAEDFIERITWIGQDSPTKEDFESCERSRYQGLGRSFPRKGQPNYYYRIQPEPGRALRATGGSQAVTVQWMSPEGPRSEKFDHAILCTGFENRVDQLFQSFEGTEPYMIEGQAVARRYIGEEIYVIGPAAELDLEPNEELPFIDIPDNVASAFRYAGKTALFGKSRARNDVARDITISKGGPLFPVQGTSIATNFDIQILLIDDAAQMIV